MEFTIDNQKSKYSKSRTDLNRYTAFETVYIIGSVKNRGKCVLDFRGNKHVRMRIASKFGVRELDREKNETVN